jgi:cell division protein FtsI/penicillin-binding protein 2
MAAVAFAIGAIVGAGHHPSAAEGVASRYVQAWSRGDYAAMYAQLDPASRATLSRGRFRGDYERAARTATAIAMAVSGRTRSLGEGLFEVPVRVTTRLFGTLHSSFRVRALSSPHGPRVPWSPALLFPGLREGESLERRTVLPARAPLLARDGSPLASGQPLSAGQRESPLGVAAEGVVGEVGPLPSSRRGQLEAEGVPADAIVGVSGLERAFDRQLRGSPGGQLLAGTRVLASVPSRRGTAVRTSISPVVQRAAATALGGVYGGVVALDPSSGQILGVAGIALDALQPPGSTFKMVTASGVLEAGIARPSSVFPYRTEATLDGVKLENANGESCGGSFALAFATSCNSVFAPLGVKLGAGRLVATAERFGFNHAPGLPGALTSTLPSPSHIQGELDVGSTAIGQGQVQASALQMAIIAATIGDGGRRPSMSFQAGTAPSFTSAISPSVARTMRRLMIGVVREGTGTAAAIPGVVVAGKTGTAELGSSHCASAEGGSESGPESGSSEEASKAGGEACSTRNPQNTDAWFAAFAPALRPRIAVGVLLVKDGAGGETAAPVAREVLEAGLH